MSDNETPLKAQGVVSPKGKSWLDEVRVDAARAQVEHLRRQKEQEEFNRDKANGITPEELSEKAQAQGLGLPPVEKPKVETEKPTGPSVDGKKG